MRISGTTGLVVALLVLSGSYQVAAGTTTPGTIDPLTSS